MFVYPNLSDLEATNTYTVPIKQAEGAQVAYREFAQPGFSTGEHSVEDWIRWMNKQGVLVPTAPRPDGSCNVCQGAVGARDAGEFWATCYQCGFYSDHLDAFVPITYSVSSGLESVLHRYKDGGPQYDWMANMLGCLLTQFLDRHGDCIEHEARGIDVATYVPQNNRHRDFDQLDRLIDRVEGSPVRKIFDWDTTVIRRNFDVQRPGRGQVRPEAYVVNRAAVEGRSVLLLDDTWTSGSSLVSSAAALKEAGAAYVVGLTIGRQLNEDSHYGSTDEILTNVRARGWTYDDCVLCI